MLEKLKEAETRYEAVAAQLSDPAVVSDREACRTLMQEQKRLLPVVEAYRALKQAEASAGEARELLRTAEDAEWQTLASEELARCEREIGRLTEELKRLLLPRDENDAKNVMVEIRGGTGGEEACLFAYVLYRMYTMYAESCGYRTQIVTLNETELGGYKEVVFRVEGDGAYSRFKFESGVHRVQRVPETESSGRIHTSTATVAVLPEAEEVEVEIDPDDLKIETIKSSGAGGQHVNKTESAIRLIHLPTGLVIECQDERSQYKNKDKAMKLLRTRLYERKRREVTDRIAAERKTQVGTGDRSERIRTYNYPQGRVTDHRIGYTSHALEAVLNGALGELIDALITADTAQKLKNQSQEDAAG